MRSEDVYKVRVWRKEEVTVVSRVSAREFPNHVHDRSYDQIEIKCSSLNNNHENLTILIMKHLKFLKSIIIIISFLAQKTVPVNYSADSSKHLMPGR